MEEGVPKKRRGCGYWVLVALGVVIVLGVLGALLGDPDAASSPQSGTRPDMADSTADQEEENDPGISAEEFAAIKTGMTHDEVTAIVGSPGELLSENEIAGTRTVMVQWNGERGFGANANAMFQNGKLIQKSQFGLE